MSLGNALQIGYSGLLASQTAINVAGNNLANAASPGYHMQTASLIPAPSQEVQNGVYVGSGVQVESIVRQVNESLEARLRDANSNESSSNATSNVLTQIQSAENELSGTGISTQLTAFFNAWSQLANTPTDSSARDSVVQAGNTLAQTISSVQQGLVGEQASITQNIQQDVTTVNGLLSQIQDLNSQITGAQGGSAGAAGLEDQRDQALTQLSQYLDISTVQQPSGVDDVYVGSTPIVLGGNARDLAVSQTNNPDGGGTITNVTIASDGTVLQPQSGELGALISANTNEVGNALNTLNQFTSNLIYQVNSVYSQGQGQTPVSSATGDYQVADPTAALDTAGAGLSFPPTSGSFQMYVTQQSTGQVTQTAINVNLNGTSSGTSLNDLVAQINANVPNVTASVTADGQLQITSNSSDYGISFGTDTSGVLASLGVNTYFSGTDASNVAVNSTVANNPSLLAVGQNNVQGDNSNALALAGLNTQSLSALGGQSLSQVWNNHVQDYAARTANAQQQVQTDSTVQQNLQAQQQSYSGVSTDQETINLLASQTAYQGVARFVSVIDQMMQTLLEIS